MTADISFRYALLTPAGKLQFLDALTPHIATGITPADQFRALIGWTYATIAVHTGHDGLLLVLHHEAACADPTLPDNPYACDVITALGAQPGHCRGPYIITGADEGCQPAGLSASHMALLATTVDSLSPVAR